MSLHLKVITNHDPLHLDRADFLTEEIPIEAELENEMSYLDTVFPDLQELNEYTSAQQATAEEQPEMHEHRRERSNILKVDKVVAWLESKQSQLLWIDGNMVLTRAHWNSTFAVPVLRDALNNFESVIIVRYFCGEYGASNRSNTPRTLVQAFIVQVLKQFQHHFAQSKAAPSKERLSRAAGSLQDLWAIFMGYVDDVNPQCIFVIIDSIDCLQDDNSSIQVSDVEILVMELNNLVKSKRIVAKILLTHSFAAPPKALTPQPSTAVGFLAPQRGMSRDLIDHDKQLVGRKLIEIDEGKCKSVLFFHLVLLYQPDSTIFTTYANEARAFVVSELGGAKTISPGRFEPLQVRCWSIEHDGRSLVKRHHEILIPQFWGEREVSKLKYVPSGYLTNEAEVRRTMLLRGRKYWDFATGFHHMQYTGEEFKRPKGNVSGRRFFRTI